MHGIDEYVVTFFGERARIPDVVLVVAISAECWANPIIGPPEISFAVGPFVPPQNAMRSL